MGTTLTQSDKTQIYEHIREFLSDELDVPLENIKPETKIIDDLHGDSMLYIELIEGFKKKYNVNVEIRVIGQYLQRHPIYTLQETAQAIYDIIERGDSLLASEGTGETAPAAP